MNIPVSIRIVFHALRILKCMLVVRIV